VAVVYVFMVKTTVKWYEMMIPMCNCASLDYSLVLDEFMGVEVDV
jgi:hypothetical protein